MHEGTSTRRSMTTTKPNRDHVDNGISIECETGIPIEEAVKAVDTLTTYDHGHCLRDRVRSFLVLQRVPALRRPWQTSGVHNPAGVVLVAILSPNTLRSRCIFDNIPCGGE